MIKLVSLLSVAVLVNSSSFSQLPGSLDPAFSMDGKLTQQLGSGNSFVNAMRFQSNDKVLVGGIVSGGTGNDYGIRRLESDGNIDSAFGQSGLTLTDFSGNDDILTGLAIDPLTNKIIAAGYTFNGNGFDFSLARYLDNGLLDSTFGDNGKVVTAIGTSSFCKSMVILPDSKILLCGYTFDSGLNQFVVVKYNSEGTLDSSFNGTGIVKVPFNISPATATSMVIQPGDNKIILAGQAFNDISQQWDLAIARLMPDGTLDNDFDGDGRCQVAISGFDSFINSVTLQNDGKIVVAGYRGTSPSNNNQLLARFKIDGVIDSSFAVNGILIDQTQTDNDQAMSVLIQSDGNILTGGFTKIGSGDRFCIRRYTSAGMPDLSFGTSGVVNTQLGMNDGINTMQIQSDNKLLVAGTSFMGSRFDFAMARYETGLSSSIPVISDGEDLISIYPNPASATFNINYNLTESGNTEIDLCDLQGRKVTVLKVSGLESSGENRRTIMLPSEVKSGTYLLRLKTERYVVSKRIVIVNE